MEFVLKIAKEIHLGEFIDRELKKQHSNMRQTAIAKNKHLQTNYAMTNAKWSMNTKLALKIEKYLGLEGGVLITLLLTV